MAVLVWFTAGVALWHFTVFIPDRFWGGIVGAFVGASIGSIVSGAVFQIAVGDSIGQTSIATVIAALPGALLGLAVIYAVGIRAEAAERELGA
jgi:hypothetical protein